MGARLMRVVQVLPYLNPGTGIGRVAVNLERELRRLGVTVETLDFARARRGRPFRYPDRGLAGRIARVRRILWFRFIGSRRLREDLAGMPDAVSICHSEALAGDVFIYHGSLVKSLRSAGRPAWQIFLNPVQLTWHLHERARFRGRRHDTVVTVTSGGRDELESLYGRVRPRVVTIPNGVDLEQFRPPPPDERARLRAEFGLDDEDRVALFVGHDLPGKRLDRAIAALVHAPTVLLLVVGGVAATVEAARRQAEELGVADRVLLIGPRNEVHRLFGMCDMFVFPSGYETFGLVVLEALASGLPVIATPVGCAPDVIVDGVNGFLVSPDPAEIGARMEQVASIKPGSWADAARASVEPFAWRHVAERYLELAIDIARRRATTPNRGAREVAS